MDTYIDISLPLKTGVMQYPSDIRCRIDRTMSIADGNAFNLTNLHLSAHTGTHVDAPRHFFDDGKAIDELPPCHFIGKARVLDFSEKKTCVDADDLAKKPINAGDIVLLKTANSPRMRADEFFSDYVYLAESGAKRLAEKGVVTLGIDALSIDGAENPDYPSHRILLGQGIVVIEGLNLSGVSEGEYTMIASPLKIEGGDGAPARVWLKAGEQE